MDVDKQIIDVLKKYPLLRYEKKENALIGELKIDESDSYNVKIILDCYPSKIPAVYEMEGRIPRKTYRHIYTNTKSCCITTDARGQILLKTKVKSLLSVIEMLIIPYFQNNSFYELNKEYCTEEYAHNSYGVIEGYHDILGITDNWRIVRLILSRIKGEKLKIKDACYCGSGLSLKKCHRGNHYKYYRDFRKIENDVLKSDLEYFDKYLKNSIALTQNTKNQNTPL